MKNEQDTLTRDREVCAMLGVKPEFGFGGIRSFNGADVGVVRKLVQMGEMSLEDTQNDSPTVGEFIEWMDNHPGFTVAGYIVAGARDDRRVSIESIHYSGEVSTELLIEFVEAFRMADSFEAGKHTLYAWWD